MSSETSLFDKQIVIEILRKEPDLSTAVAVAVAVCEIAYLLAGVYAASLVYQGVSREGWLFNCSLYRGNLKLLAESWEVALALVLIIFAFWCWWLILPIYYTGPIARERKSKT